MSFDPFNQNITMTSSDGSTMSIPLHYFDEFVQDGVVSCINYGSQLGATIVIFVLLCLLTRSKKRSSIVFCLNVSALLLNMARLICQVLQYTGAWFETYAYFSGDISHVSRGDFANSILVQVMNALLEIVVEASLVTQTKVVTTNMSRWQKTAILAVSAALAVVTIGFRMVQMVLYSMLIVENRPFDIYLWLQKVNTIFLTVTICYFSAVLICKLGYTVYRRRQLGVHQFGPIQVIFIMSCQTMVIPALFSILQFSSVSIHQINTDIFTFVVVSLPVTTLWASAALPGHAAAHDVESGVPLWTKLSTTRLGSMDSRQSRKKSASPSETPSGLNFQGSELAKSVTIGSRLEESVSAQSKEI
ncbi:mating-type alpha-pheromone receptor PreB [Talaromyces stipitatus ATCC 10500]|uniref:Mating-type alpha-pheromone receptor PreB n=1 Tax=Talaromyces stipitatus (strain ATCC 10500 / CBS 375.48 / QM 6759 / NRRL 1006) TaxID=441959 RepID=B8M557_TALSN|nr:mating-type alpha-pheromone receptor PreB [Talaromyces stipitatus ATCC 10500]EED19663.1 mating-type alpha-pheromone receptor PreB [Talaromyces stipitatus ATCC 10500]